VKQASEAPFYVRLRGRAFLASSFTCDEKTPSPGYLFLTRMGGLVVGVGKRKHAKKAPNPGYPFLTSMDALAVACVSANMTTNLRN